MPPAPGTMAGRQHQEQWLAHIVYFFVKQMHEWVVMKSFSLGEAISQYSKM